MYRKYFWMAPASYQDTNFGTLRKTACGYANHHHNLSTQSGTLHYSKDTITGADLARRHGGGGGGEG